MQEALYAVSEKSEELTGTIRMSVPTISGELLLSESVAEFCALHPSLKVEMRLENRFVDLVEEGIDLAIRTGTMPDSSLIARPIFDSRWVIVCSPEYRKPPGTTQRRRPAWPQLPDLHLSGERHRQLADETAGAQRNLRAAG